MGKIKAQMEQDINTMTFGFNDYVYVGKESDFTSNYKISDLLFQVDFFRVNYIVEDGKYREGC